MICCKRVIPGKQKISRLERYAIYHIMEWYTLLSQENFEYSAEFHGTPLKIIRTRFNKSASWCFYQVQGGTHCIYGWHYALKQGISWLWNRFWRRCCKNTSKKFLCRWYAKVIPRCWDSNRSDFQSKRVVCCRRLQINKVWQQ